MEIWDGYNRDGNLANVDLIRGEMIPDGIYHLVCEILVRHTDGSYLLMQRSYEKPNHGGEYEATAGGSALKGEDKMSCAKRELFEETGILAEDFQEIDMEIKDENHCIFYSYLCMTDCDKNAVRLQEGETIGYKWLSEAEFIAFIHSGEMIESQKHRYEKFFKRMGYIK